MTPVPFSSNGMTGPRWVSYVVKIRSKFSDVGEHALWKGGEPIMDQMLMASALLEELESFLPNLLEDTDITPLLILDALGCAGLSLTEGDEASKAFLRECGAEI